MPKGFSFVDVGKMYFNHGDIQQRQGISDGNAGMGKAAGFIRILSQAPTAC
jgi:hypothetical protein